MATQPTTYTATTSTGEVLTRTSNLVYKYAVAYRIRGFWDWDAVWCGRYDRAVKASNHLAKQGSKGVDVSSVQIIEAVAS